MHEAAGLNAPEPMVTEKFTVPVGSAVVFEFVTVAVQVEPSLTETGEVQETEVFVLSAAYPKNPAETNTIRARIKADVPAGRNFVSWNNLFEASLHLSSTSVPLPSLVIMRAPLFSLFLLIMIY
jgi:hypothetical protein